MLRDNQDYSTIEELINDIKQDKNNYFIIIRTFDLSFLFIELQNILKEDACLHIEKCSNRINLEYDIKIIELLNEEYDSLKKSKVIFILRTDLNLDEIDPSEKNKYPYVCVTFKRIWNEKIHSKKLITHLNQIKYKNSRYVPNIDFLKSFYFQNFLSWKDNPVNLIDIKDNINYLIHKNIINRNINNLINNLLQDIENFDLTKLRIILDEILSRYYPNNDFENKFSFRDILNNAVNYKERHEIKNNMTSEQRYQLYIYHQYTHILDACNMHAHGRSEKIDKLIKNTILLEFLGVLKFIITDIHLITIIKKQNS